MLKLVEIHIGDDELYPYFYLSDKRSYTSTALVDEKTVAWIEAGMSQFNEVQEFLQNLHKSWGPDR